MDIWIPSFIVLTIVAFLISFSIPQVANRSSRKKKEKYVPPPSKEIAVEYKEEELVHHEDDYWDIDAPSDNVQENEATLKGLRIAWKQYNNELDTFLRELNSSPRVMSYHKSKYEELDRFYNNTLKSHTNVLSDQDLKIIKEKLAHAKQLIVRY